MDNAVTHVLVEHGPHRRVDTRQKIRGLVHPEHGARSTRLRFPPQQPVAHSSKSSCTLIQARAGALGGGATRKWTKCRLGRRQGLSVYALVYRPVVR